MDVLHVPCVLCPGCIAPVRAGITVLTETPPTSPDGGERYWCRCSIYRRAG